MANETGFPEDQLLRFLIGFVESYYPRRSVNCNETRDFCVNQTGTENFFWQQVALAFPKDSPILERVNTE